MKNLAKKHVYSETFFLISHYLKNDINKKYLDEKVFVMSFKDWTIYYINHQHMNYHIYKVHIFMQAF